MTTPERDDERLRELAAELREYDALVKDGIPFSLGRPTYQRWATQIETAAARCDALETALLELLRAFPTERILQDMEREGLKLTIGRGISIDAVRRFRALLSAEPPAPDGAQEGFARKRQTEGWRMSNPIYILSMGCVSGDDVQVAIHRYEDIIPWLKQLDHEGSSWGVCSYGLCDCDGGPQGEGLVSLPHELTCPAALYPWTDLTEQVQQEYEHDLSN